MFFVKLDKTSKSLAILIQKKRAKAIITNIRKDDIISLYSKKIKREYYK